MFGTALAKVAFWSRLSGTKLAQTVFSKTIFYSFRCPDRESMMTNLHPSTQWPENFCGSVKLFPLPNVVLFPNAVLPLHVFEPRYCEMLADSLSSDRLLAMAVFKPGWESQYEQRPPVAPTVCVGRVISHTACENERHNILLVGIKRATIVHEIDSSKPYRMAEVELIEDEYPPQESLYRPQLVQRLAEMFQQFVPDGLAAQQCLDDLVSKQLPLGIMTDIITHAITLPLPIKLQLLAEGNVDIRCRILTRCLEQKLKEEGGSADSAECGESFPQGFPPEFSDN